MYLTTCSGSVIVHVEKEKNKTHSVFLKVVKHAVFDKLE